MINRPPTSAFLGVLCGLAPGINRGGRSGTQRLACRPTRPSESLALTHYVPQREQQRDRRDCLTGSPVIGNAQNHADERNPENRDQVDDRTISPKVPRAAFPFA